MSTYGMKSKLRPVIAPHKKRQYMALSLWSRNLSVIYGPETNFICQGVSPIYVITSCHARKLKNRKGLIFSA